MLNAIVAVQVSNEYRQGQFALAQNAENRSRIGSNESIQF